MKMKISRNQRRTGGRRTGDNVSLFCGLGKFELILPTGQ